MSGSGGKGGIRGSGGRLLKILSAISALSALSASPALSQTDRRLVEIIRQAQEGQGDSARIKVQRLLAATSPADTLYPQIIYTQAMVANDAGDMRRQLQRVAVEYSSSSWADDALLRLVQLDYASGNLESAARNLERIRLDYPGSSLVPQAAYWAARTYFDQRKPDLACRWIAQGITAAQGNVELQNQLGYLNQRCAQVAGGPRTTTDSQPGGAPAGDTSTTLARVPDTARPTVRPDTIPSPRADTLRADSMAASLPAATPARRFRLQITAVRSQTAAQGIAARLKARGYSPVVFEENGLFKVRIGSYPTRSDAMSALPGIKAKLGGSPFVVTEP
jgi:cell division septation protein DedD